MRTPPAPLCPSCERPVTDGAALCPYCGEPLPGGGRPGRVAPVLFLAGVLALCALPAALFDFPLDSADIRAAVADAFGLGRGDEVWRSVLRGLGALLVFLPVGRRAVGAPAPTGISELLGGVAWRLLLLADGAVAGAVLAEAAGWSARLFGCVVFAACIWGVWRFRLGWRALAALLLVAAASFAANG